MPLLSSSSHKATTLAPPLPVANKILSQHGIVLRRGQFSLLAAAPGVGKTIFANNLTLFTPVPALYFSADSDEWTVKQRISSILTGHKLEEVDRNFNEEQWENYYTDLLRAADHIDFCYETDIDMMFTANRINAYAELRGDYPELIVVDNLGNCVTDSENDIAELRSIARELQRMARNTKAHIMALHHVTGDSENGDKPITLGSIMGKVSKLPEVVLGLSRQGDNELLLTVPKNRGGKSRLAVRLPISYETASIGGYR